MAHVSLIVMRHVVPWMRLLSKGLEVHGIRAVHTCKQKTLCAAVYHRAA